MPRGRLAPSPTGRLHLGNLGSSLLAWAEIRRRGGDLLLRIEDLDPPRVVDGAEAALIDDLQWLGIDWDAGPGDPEIAGPWHQSERGPHYAAATRRLAEAGAVYPCTCSRREIAEALSAPHAAFDPSTRYPGTCADRTLADVDDDGDHALRVRARGVWTVEDRVFGPITHDLAVTPGDFVIRRRDGLWAYQLAVSVDDVEMGVTDILRGYDLLDSAPRQAALHAALGGDPIAFWHVPLLVDARGERLAKRTGAMGRDGLVEAGWCPDTLRGGLANLYGLRADFTPLTGDAFAASFAVRPLRRPEIRVPDAFFVGPDAWRRHLELHGAP